MLMTQLCNYAAINWCGLFPALKRVQELFHARRGWVELYARASMAMCMDGRKLGPILNTFVFS